MTCNYVYNHLALFQAIAVDADPRNLAYLRTSLDVNNSTRNVRIIYNAVRFLYSSWAQCYNITIYITIYNQYHLENPVNIMINKMTSSSNEEVTLYPIIPDPTNEGAVHMYTEERLLAEKINVIQL